MLSKVISSLALVGAMLVAPAAFAGDTGAQAKMSLSRNLPRINFTGVTFKEAVDFLRDFSGLNIHVNWKAIEAAGVAADTPVNIKLRDVPVRKALSLVLSEASGGVGLTFYVEDGVVEITTREIANAQMLTVVYPVQDLLFEPPPVDAPPDFSLATKGNRTVRPGPGAASQPDTKAQELIRLITETVQPDAWVDNGGKSSIKYFSGSLIVTAPRSIQEAIGGLSE
ncbi:MAG: hypothetical protein ACHRHE_19615 [Tepidisphaerales bacterium]